MPAARPAARSRPELDLQLHVAHLNHQLRGDEAQADADFVRDIAQHWDLPYTIESRDVAALRAITNSRWKKRPGKCVTASCSKWRSRSTATIIAVAHNADDQAESVLMHFLRGSGLAGLRGMLPKMLT